VAANCGDPKKFQNQYTEYYDNMFFFYRDYKFSPELCNDQIFNGRDSDINRRRRMILIAFPTQCKINEHAAPMGQRVNCIKKLRRRRIRIRVIRLFLVFTV